MYNTESRSHSSGTGRLVRRKLVPNVSRLNRLLGTPGINDPVTWRHSLQERRPQLRHSESLKTLKTSRHSQPNNPESIRRKFGDDRENNFMLYTLPHQSSLLPTDAQENGF